FGTITDLRGDITVSAGSIGALAPNLGASQFVSLDPRALGPDVIKHSLETPGPTVIPGDGTVSITTRGDLVFGGVGDAGMGATVDLNGFADPALNVGGGASSSFMLWRPTTAIGLYSAGGDVAPLTGAIRSGASNSVENANGFYPGTLIAVAANGDIRFDE